MIAGQWFAFAETVEQIGPNVYARFDLIQPIDLEAILAVKDQERAPLLQALPAPVLVVELPLVAVPRFFGRSPSEGEWYSVTLADNGANAQFFANLAAEGGVQVRILALHWLDGRSSPGRDLRRIFSLARIAVASQQELEDALGHFAHRAPGGFAVYNVGQGSVSAIVDANNVPILYFDLGGGCITNAASYPTPNRLRLCWSYDPPVVLSHWDFDHYFTATLLPRARQATWIVPDQPQIGVNATKLTKQIQANGRLLKWGSAPLQVASPAGTGARLVRPNAKSKSKNYSGLFLTLTLAENGTTIELLAAADGKYADISAHHPPALDALIASHHGAKRSAKAIPPPTAQHRVIYSYGQPNTFGHPVGGDTAHQSCGWATDKRTPHGHVIVACHPACGAQPCGDITCSLRPAQQ